MEQIIIYSVLLVGFPIATFLIIQPCLLKQKQTIKTSLIRIPNSVNVQIGVASLIGPRPTMEDAHVVSQINDHLILAIADGHSGSKCSEFLARNLVSEFQNQYKHYQKDIIKAAKQALKNLDERFLKLATQLGLLDGSTLCLIVIKGNKVYCFNVGDSRALLCSNFASVPLSLDHKPENEKESQRITAVGGFVHANGYIYENTLLYSGPQRIYPGGLSVSRAFGDLFFKDQQYLENLAVSNQLVVSQPEISVHPLSCDQFLIIACDGLYDVFSNIQLIQFVTVMLALLLSKKQKSFDILLILGITQQHQRTMNTAKIIAQTLTRQAIKAGSSDNVSVIFVQLMELWPLKLSAAKFLPQFAQMQSIFEKGDVSEQLKSLKECYEFETFVQILDQCIDEMEVEYDEICFETICQQFPVIQRYFGLDEDDDIVYETKTEFSETDYIYRIDELQSATKHLWKRLEVEGFKLSDLRSTLETRGYSDEGGEIKIDILDCFIISKQNLTKLTNLCSILERNLNCKYELNTYQNI